MEAQGAIIVAVCRRPIPATSPASAGATPTYGTCLLCDEFSAERADKIGLIQEKVVPLASRSSGPWPGPRSSPGNAPLGAVQVTKEAGRKFIEAGEAAAVAFYP